MNRNPPHEPVPIGARTFLSAKLANGQQLSHEPEPSPQPSPIGWEREQEQEALGGSWDQCAKIGLGVSHPNLLPSDGRGSRRRPSPLAPFQLVRKSIAIQISKAAVRCLCLLGLLVLFTALQGATLSVASYNVELYLDKPEPALSAPAKSPEAKAKIRETLKALNADVVALQEMSSEAGLQELQNGLAAEGLIYRHAELMPAADATLRLAFLSKYPILSQHRYTNENYLLRGRRQVVARGFLGIEVQSPGAQACTIINAHFKSKRQILEADDAEMREQEAVLLRERMEKLLGPSRRNIILLGDFNDTIESRPLRILLGRGPNALHDIRPAEPNGDSGFKSDPKFHARDIVWTHYFSREETYSRIDYILATKDLWNRLDRTQTYIATIPDWGIASDHRALKATFKF